MLITSPYILEISTTSVPFILCIVKYTLTSRSKSSIFNLFLISPWRLNEDGFMSSNLLSWEGRNNQA